MAKPDMQAIRFERDLRSQTEENLAAEAPLQITVNRLPFTVTMRTPGSDARLACGLLFTEGLIRSHADITEMTMAENNVHVRIAPEILDTERLGRRRLISAAACGVCGKTELCDLHIPENPLTTEWVLDPGLLAGMQAQVRQSQRLFAETGGVHAAAAFTIQGKMLAVFEDIGRHNAVDKTVGFLLSENLLNETALLFVSGRVSYEIVTKTHRAGIPFLAAVSAVSDMAAEMCVQLGITLLGFCREQRATAYAHAERLVSEKKHARTA